MSIVYATRSQHLDYRTLQVIGREVQWPTSSEWPSHFGLLYPSTLPAAIPDGLVLVHNNVRRARRQGTRGFRFWFQSPVPRLVLCDCPWAPELGQHHVVGQASRR